MHRQTVNEIMPLLTILDQPAFCIRANGALVFNQRAKNVVPSCAAALPQWMGQSKALYDMWDRSGNLQICVDICGVLYSVTLQALQDGTLFLMSPAAVGEQALDVLAVASQIMRMPLADLSSSFSLISPDKPIESTGPLYRQLYRMTRIVSNLTDLGRLSAKEPHLVVEDLDTDSFLLPLLDEIAELCRSADRQLQYELPKKSVTFCGDGDLLRRAILNLVSNALKYSPAGTPLCLRVEVIGTHITLRLENTCTDDGSELLRAAFTRLTQRGFLPDPNWGLGLGLPLAAAIARLHGGMVAVETLDGKATVCLSVSRRKPSVKLASPLRVDYTGGMRQTLLELSDVLPSELYGK